MTLEQVEQEISRAMGIPIERIIIGRNNKGGYTYILQIRGEDMGWRTVAHAKTPMECLCVFREQVIEDSVQTCRGHSQGGYLPLDQE